MERYIKPAKEAYERPTVRRVKVVPNEMVAAVCKVANSSTGLFAGCTGNVIVSPCFDPGS